MADDTGYRENQGSADSRNDPKSNRITDLENRVPHLLDKRKTVTYTFKGTGEESFLHQLGAVPTGASIVNIDKHANIKYNLGPQGKTNAQRFYATSDTPGATVTFLLF